MTRPSTPLPCIRRHPIVIDQSQYASRSEREAVGTATARPRHEVVL
jgi:hypothetical protein